MSRTPLQNATSMVFQNTAGWQSLVSNGVLYATTILPDGMTLHLFTTHLQCTTAPPAEASCSSPDSNTARVLNMVEGGTENVRMRQLYEMKSFMDRTICFEDDMWLLAGDLNIEGGSHEYYEMVQLFGREALGAPEFQSTYNTESFLTPPGWRGVCPTPRPTPRTTNYKMLAGTTICVLIPLCVSSYYCVLILLYMYCICVLRCGVRRVPGSRNHQPQERRRLQRAC